MADEETPLKTKTVKSTVTVNDQKVPPAYYSKCREFVGGIFELLIVFPLLLVLCIIISPLLLYWLIQIWCVFDPRGMKNGQGDGYAPKMNENGLTSEEHIGTMKILFVIPDGGYCPAELSIFYNTLMSHKRHETDKIEIIIATASGAIDEMNVIDNDHIEVFAYGCDPLFRHKCLGFGLLNVPFVKTYYRTFLESIDWYNSHHKAQNTFKQVISFDEIETENIGDIYDGIYIAGGHHWNYNKLYKNRVLHYKLSKLWQLSLDTESGMNEPIQFAAIGRGVSVLAYALHTHSLVLDEDDSNKQNLELKYDENDTENEASIDIAIRQASKYDSDTDSGDDLPSMLPSSSELVPPSPSPRHSKHGNRASTKPRQSSKANTKKRQSKKAQRSILYHVHVTTLPEWCEFLGNLVALLPYGQIFSASNQHMKSCAEIVENAVGDTDKTITMMQEKKFYHKGPENWLVWFFQGVYNYCTQNDFRLTYVVEDSHIVTGRWFIDAHLVAKRFMEKMAKQ